MRLRIFLLLLLLASTLFAGGCYTVLKHPEGAVLVDEYENRKSCGDCHQASWFYHQDPYWYGGNYYGTYYPYEWYDYYSRPWWYDDYWYYGGGWGESGTVETGKRHLWTTPSLRPPDNISMPPAMKVPQDTQSGSTSGKQTPSQGTTQKEEEKKTEKKRHLWDK